MKRVYQAANAIEAHMILHLLQQSGIAGHVEGEYLQGGIGELPAAGLVNVVVDDEQAQHALAVIRDWESSAPPVQSGRGGAGRVGALSWLLAGALLGGAVVWTLCRSLRGF